MLGNGYLAQYLQKPASIRPRTGPPMFDLPICLPSPFTTLPIEQEAMKTESRRTSYPSSSRSRIRLDRNTPGKMGCSESITVSTVNVETPYRYRRMFTRPSCRNFLFYVFVHKFISLVVSFSPCFLALDLSVFENHEFTNHEANYSHERRGQHLRAEGQKRTHGF